jgi:hypothetical protein
VTASVSLLPSLTGAMVPPPNIPDALSDDEQRWVTGLSTKLASQTPAILSRWLYYDGEQRMLNLGISIPEVLAGVRVVVDWPRICCDPLVGRANIAGFRMPKATEIDDELAGHWQANDMDGEFPLAVLDSLVAGRGYLVVGAPDVAGESPIVTVESPLNMTVTWDPRTRSVLNAYQAYETDGLFKATLYLPNQNIYMSRSETTQWVVERRDEHRFGEVSVTRMPNRARTSDREGRSQITRAVQTTTDSACRSLLGMEIAREVYSVPHLAILGASEANFVDPSGRRKSALDMAMNKIIALERDESGDLPTLQQLKAFDPAVFTKIIDNGAQRMAAFTGFPPAYFGQTTTANPASADAIRVAEAGVDRAGEQVQRQSTAAARRTAQLIWRFANGGRPLPADIQRLEVDWIDAATPTPAATSDAMVKQAGAGMVPPTSDVTLSRLGYSAVERARLAQDRDKAQQLESELTSSLAARQARAGNAIANDLEKAAGLTTAPPPPAGGGPGG